MLEPRSSDLRGGERLFLAYSERKSMAGQVRQAMAPMASHGGRHSASFGCGGVHEVIWEVVPRMECRTSRAFLFPIGLGCREARECGPRSAVSVIQVSRAARRRIK